MPPIFSSLVGRIKRPIQRFRKSSLGKKGKDGVTVVFEKLVETVEPQDVKEVIPETKDNCNIHGDVDTLAETMTAVSLRLDHHEDDDDSEFKNTNEQEQNEETSAVTPEVTPARIVTPERPPVVGPEDADATPTEPIPVSVSSSGAAVEVDANTEQVSVSHHTPLLPIQEEEIVSTILQEEISPPEVQLPDETQSILMDSENKEDITVEQTESAPELDSATTVPESDAVDDTTVESALELPTTIIVSDLDAVDSPAPSNTGASVIVDEKVLQLEPSLSNIVPPVLDSLPDANVTAPVPETADNVEPLLLDSHGMKTDEPDIITAEIPETAPPETLEDGEKQHVLDPAVDIDPFLVDDPEEIVANSHQEEPASDTVDISDAPETDSILDSTVATSPATHNEVVPETPVDVNKDVPPPPSEPEADSDDDKPRAPEVYVPALIMPTMFLPIPNSDPLTTLLTKHIPESHLRPTRDVSGDWQNSDFDSLVMTNSWRALARMARDRIVATNPIEIDLILNLWYLRLSCLARLRLFSQTTTECANLYNVLSAIEPLSTRIHVLSRILPFELDVLRARCIYWAGDPNGYLDATAALLRRCRNEARHAHDSVDSSMWVERGSRMCLILASQLIEMRDYTAATSLLESLLSSPTTSAALHSAVARIYLQAGNIARASYHFSIVEQSSDADEPLKFGNALILAAANGDWVTSADCAKKLLEQDGSDLMAVNNLAVALLSQGKLKEAISILEDALQASPSAVAITEPFLFNLSTLYELRAGLGVNKKRNLLIEVAKWSGDGLRTTALKMSAG